MVFLRPGLLGPLVPGVPVAPARLLLASHPVLHPSTHIPQYAYLQRLCAPYTKQEGEHDKTREGANNNKFAGYVSQTRLVDQSIWSSVYGKARREVLGELPEGRYTTRAACEEGFDTTSAYRTHRALQALHTIVCYETHERPVADRRSPSHCE